MANKSSQFVDEQRLFHLLPNIRVDGPDITRGNVQGNSGGAATKYYPHARIKVHVAIHKQQRTKCDHQPEAFTRKQRITST
eukprot:6200144-Pleurochrysis_carterae.AAC.1